METARNLPVLVWQEAADDFVADCVLIPRCRAHAHTRDDAIDAVKRLIAGRLRTRRAEGWHLPHAYEVGHVPTSGSALPLRR
jgi:predicted RNase H-like HicB family nuclease